MIILRDLFVNACIIVAVIFAGGLFFLDMGIGSRAPIKAKILSGIINGFLGIILMTYSIKVTPDVIVDLRHFSFIVGSIYLGGLSTFITGVIIAIFRLFYNGMSDLSIIVSAFILIATIGSILIGKLNLTRKIKWILLCLYTTGIFSISISLAVRNHHNLIIILMYYWIGSLITSVGLFYYTKFLKNMHRIYERLKLEANTDYLTGLRNTRDFDTILSSLVSSSEDNDYKISLLLIDLDHFKNVNDTYGHSSGDEVLRQFSQILHKSVRNFDVVARVGGEEFCILLYDCGKEKAYEIAERIRKSVETNIFWLPSGDNINITISVGIASYPDTIHNLERLRESADIQLYKAKNEGRNMTFI